MCLGLAAGIVALAGGPTARAAEPAQGYQAWISVRKVGRVYEISPTCLAPHDGLISYSLAARRQGRAGSSVSSQSGRASMRAGQEKVLCRLALSIQEGDQYEIVLDVFEDGQAVAHSVLACPQGI